MAAEVRGPYEVQFELGYDLDSNGNGSYSDGAKIVALNDTEAYKEAKKLFEKRLALGRNYIGFRIIKVVFVQTRRG